MERRAADDAVKGVPPGDATEPTSTEREVVDKCRVAYLELNSKSAEIIEEVIREFADREKLPTQRDFEVTEQHSDTKVEELLLTSRESLLALRTDYEVAAVHWRYFRDQNRLHREARYPANHRLHIALLVLFVLIEAVLNSFFFAEANALGIVGGIVVALFISIASILLGYAAGRYVRPLASSSSGSERLKGQLGVLGWVVLFLALHFLVAHYRDLSTSLKDDTRALFEAPLHAVQHPLDLSVLSIVMFLIGAMLGLLAFIDGSQWDDLYPGYGEVDRRFKQARSALGAEIQRTREELTQRIRAASLESSRLRMLAEGQVRRLGELVAVVDPLRSAYDGGVAMIISTCRTLLTAYRNKNRFIQGVATGPSHFGDFPEFPKALDLSRTSDLPRRLESAGAAVQKLCQWDSDIHRNEVARLRAGNDRLEQFLKTVEADAERSADVVHARGMVRERQP